VTDGKLSIRFRLKDETTPAGACELYFSMTAVQ